MANAQLVGPTGEINVGIDPGAFAQPGVNPQDPSVIASQFGAYDAARNAVPPAAPPAVQAPVDGQAPVAASDPNQPPAEGDPNPAQDGTVQTSADLAAMFEGETSVDDLFGSITHEIGGQNYTLSEIVSGFAAQPDAAATVMEREGLSAQFAQRAQAQQSVQETAMTKIASLTQKLQARVSSQEDPQKLAMLLNRDPVGYQAKILEIEADKTMLANAEREQESLKETASGQEQMRLSEWHASENRHLATKFPEWTNPETGPALKAKITSYARSMGFNDMELGQVEDHRFLCVLRDAAKGHELMLKGAKVLKSAKDRKLAAPPSKPHARGELPGKDEAGNQSRADSFRQLQKDGSLESAASVFGSLV